MDHAVDYLWGGSGGGKGRGKVEEGVEVSGGVEEWG
jgi:hypothetical protein